MRTVDAVAALLVRDLRGFFRSRSQLYSSVFFPLMLLAILGTGVSEGLDPRNIDDYTTFLTPGMIVMTALFSSTFSSATYYQDRDSGILRVLFASPHSQRVILLGKTLSSVVIGIAQALIVLGVAAAIPAINFDWQYGVLQSIALTVAGGRAAQPLPIRAGPDARVAHPFDAGLPSGDEPRAVPVPVLLRRVLSARSAAVLAEDPRPHQPAVVRGRSDAGFALRRDGSDGYFGVPVDLAVLAVLAVAVFYLGTSRRAGIER